MLGKTLTCVGAALCNTELPELPTANCRGAINQIPLCRCHKKCRGLIEKVCFLGISLKTQYAG